MDTPTMNLSHSELLRLLYHKQSLDREWLLEVIKRIEDLLDEVHELETELETEIELGGMAD